MKDNERHFLERRMKLIGHWRYAGPALLIAIVGLGIYLWFSAPMLINPFAVGEQLGAGEIAVSALSVSALMLPVVMLLLLGVLVLIVLFLYAAFSNERRYQKIIDSKRKRPE